MHRGIQLSSGLYLLGRDHARWKDYNTADGTGLPNRMAKGFLSEARAPTEIEWRPEWCEESGIPALNRPPGELSLEESLVILVHDFVEYFTLVRFWPSFVQAVRFQLNQADRSRLNDWMVPKSSLAADRPNVS